MTGPAKFVVLAIASCALCVAFAFAQDSPDAPPPAAPPAATPAPAAGPAAPLVAKATITCDGKVKTDGTVSVLVTPEGGAAAEIRVTLQKGMERKDVCRDLGKELGVALGPSFKVQGEGDQVRVAGASKSKKFSLVLGGQTATGVTLAIKVK